MESRRSFLKMMAASVAALGLIGRIPSRQAKAAKARKGAAKQTSITLASAVRLEDGDIIVIDSEQFVVSGAQNSRTLFVTRI